MSEMDFTTCPDCGINYNNKTYDGSTLERRHICEYVYLKEFGRACRMAKETFQVENEALRKALKDLLRAIDIEDGDWEYGTCKIIGASKSVLNHSEAAKKE